MAKIGTQLVPTWREGDDYGRVPSNTFENKHYNEMKRAWQKLAHRRMINQRDIRQLTDYR
jgi:hypothetical protein